MTYQVVNFTLKYRLIWAKNCNLLFLEIHFMAVFYVCAFTLMTVISPNAL